MVREIIKDKAGNPVSVLLSYKEWLEVEQLVAQQQRKATAPENPLDWYTLTETTNAILNELIAYTGREKVAELQKPDPDQQRIEALWSLFREVQAINRNADNFKDAGRMQEIIEAYSPKLKKVNDGGQLV